jgi:hypothetical protein
MLSCNQKIKLGDGVSAEFQDMSNRYFGDFNRVFVKVKIRIEKRLIEHQKDLLAMIAADKTEIIYQTSLEQMAVTTAEVAIVRENLINAFIKNTQSYIVKPTFIENLIKKKKQSL